MTAIQERAAAAADRASPPASGRRASARTALIAGRLRRARPADHRHVPAGAADASPRDLETTSAAVQLTLTGTLVGLALGQLVLGPLSDALGRRRPLLAGTALHVLASLLVLVAPNRRRPRRAAGAPGRRAPRPAR